MTDHRILVIGDSYMTAEVFTRAFAQRGIPVDTATMTIAEPTWDASTIHEFEGDPAEVARVAEGYDVVAFHAAPFTAEVLAALPGLRLLGCARGGPVNVDLAAARERGVRVTTTPGKNADAVADLTIGFLISIVRNVPASLRDVDERVAEGRPLAESTFEGARWFGREVKGLRLGLIGYGNVARLVAARARALGATISAYDPYVDPATVTDATIVSDLDALLSGSDVVSVHARATADNRHLIGAAQIARMPQGSFLINTARESLVDEQALLDALRSGHLAGVALDVNEPDGPWRELVAQPNLILTPHLAGATAETLARGADMLASEVAAFLAGGELRWER
ncbi:NAD(P)-dependent oxidoreductase [Microbacterium paraoxydans]|uniref:Hydroxyacid dehydrogenase n=1 Tax=Microbacterium paraoxydans TaxID=199592 RepID=A0ABS5IJ16_9MICO|nr:NAD(P)-dependent oxidoreductase [Microbacterium paraoxydans]MBS0022953.1 hydroxyacid dehydrogenase [Microbacterium paraoxydans]